MRQVVNESVSKRPIKVPDSQDLAKLQKDRERLDRDIARLEKLEAAHKTPYFQELIVESYMMMRAIETQMAMMAVDNSEKGLVERAQLKGRWLERFDLTKSLVRDENCRRTTVGRLQAVINRIVQVAEQMKGKT